MTADILWAFLTYLPTLKSDVPYRNSASKVYRVLSNYNFGSPIQIKLSSALTLIASLSKTNGMRYRYFSHITCICYIHFKVEIILAVNLPKVT